IHIRVTEGILRKQVEKYRDLVAQRDLAFADPGTQLYNTVLAPAAAELAGRSSIVILPDGPLWQLPFQTLISTGGRFLTEIYQISYAPSITVLASLMGKKKLPASGARLLAMAQGLEDAEDEV